MYGLLFALGDKEKDKLKEVLGWVDGFVKVPNCSHLSISRVATYLW